DADDALGAARAMTMPGDQARGSGTEHAVELVAALESRVSEVRPGHDRAGQIAGRGGYAVAEHRDGHAGAARDPPGAWHAALGPPPLPLAYGARAGRLALTGSRAGGRGQAAGKH